ncbi:Gfo/Idh/MocA family protein [Deinococcus roseus]|uniref:Oxidoreductase n=1 Tax=Deinococcus roseus TaxID=392414 RepID=A0ABQ2CWA9_9DEIO|nr:Gfo/Idh/MocA family oxidoreductase [Deinococcus roseus]GGJ27161.1 oxidoreductase [Deinococcus roseus]
MTLKYGMIGGGKDAFIGGVHRKAIALDSTAELVAGAFSSNPEKALASGKELGVKRNYPTWEAMLEGELALPEEERIDFVVIVTPNHMHYPTAKAFAEAGFNVVSDKPLVHSSEQAEDLVRIVQEKGVVFGVTYNYTGYPMVRQAREMVRRGDLGKIRKVIVEYNQGWLATRLEETGAKQADWRTDPKRSGIAGAMGDIGSHAENLMGSITGLHISHICADLTTFVEGRQLDDDGNVLLRFENGAKGVLIASQIEIGMENDLRIRVFGEKGSLVWHQEDPNSLEFHRLGEPVQILKRGNDYLCDAAKKATRIPAGHPEAFLEAFANIYRGVAEAIEARKAGTPLTEFEFPTVQEGAIGVKFIEKVVESSHSDQKWTEF